MRTLGSLADDHAEADGTAVMSFVQAQRAVLGTKPKVGGFSVADAIKLYLEYLEGHQKATYSDSKVRAEALIIPALRDIAVEALTTAQIRGWHSALARSRGRHTKQSDAETARRRKVTANRTLIILRAALNLAYREGYVPSDAAWRRVRPFKNVDTARIRYLTIAEAVRLINACDPDFRRLVQAALQTGCRYGELIRLGVADFNPDSGTVHVRQSKGGKSRHVFLSEEGVALFQGWTVGRVGGGRGGLILTRDGHAWSENGMTAPMLRACKIAGIVPPVGFHQLRHSFASLAIMAGAPLLVIAKTLGHRDTRMVEMHYGHLTESYVADAMRAAVPRFGVVPDPTVVPMTPRRKVRVATIPATIPL